MSEKHTSEQKQSKLNPCPGDIVVTTFGMYQHWSLVTDQMGVDGRYMLISATKRNGTVKEETWSVVTQGKPTYITRYTLKIPLGDVLKKARGQVDQWRYSVSRNNCEHFVKWATGMKLSSRQVRSCIEGAVVGGVVAGMATKKTRWLNVLGGAVTMAGLAVASSRASKRKVTDYSGTE
ncbi:lecithin retinol acyltransferase family protein [Oceanospirillum sediminis]|uniref:Lecithin retinol acyltransferase family protein n=1 Tax=Oceanospirillum sediminis TaxID=2760088 RepID=A0A839IN49_9GAMM|nr:lecithin retinol acyltransferase family protein [Oceanospirillum sediminis]MBB1485929.1 lecithin retinol acyltransferase family protein [Oceanospirillum sediminis]